MQVHGSSSYNDVSSYIALDTTGESGHRSRYVLHAKRALYHLS